MGAPGSPGSSAGDRPTAWAAELAVAEEVAIQAGRLLAERVGTHGSVTYKGPRDIVTEVDHASEALIRDALAASFPGDDFLGEEGGHGPGGYDGPGGHGPGGHDGPGGHGPAGHDGPGGRSLAARAGRDAPAPAETSPTASSQPSTTSAAGRTWVCDPVDGTINYANGIPFFCVSLALVVDGRPVVGVVHDPMRGELYAATADGPATLDGVVVRASAKERLTDYVAALAISGPRPATRARRVRKAIRISRSMGSAALSLAYVANGRFDAFGQSAGLSAWDIAAAGLIAERSGAIVTNLAGGPWFDLLAKARTTGVLAAPAAFHGELLALLRVDA